MRVDTMRILRYLILISAILFPVAAIATVGVPTPDVIAKHAGLFEWVLGIAIAYNLWMTHRWVKASEANNQAQWEAIHHTNKAVAEIKLELREISVEHKIFHHGKDDK